MRLKVVVAGAAILAIIAGLVLAQRGIAPSASAAKSGNASDSSKKAAAPASTSPREKSGAAKAKPQPAEATPMAPTPEKAAEKPKEKSSVPPEALERFEKLQKEKDTSDRDIFGRGKPQPQDYEPPDLGAPLPPPSEDEVTSTHSQLRLRGKSLWLDEK